MKDQPAPTSQNLDSNKRLQTFIEVPDRLYVKHKTYGYGTPIYGEHAPPDSNGNIEWFSVRFPDCERIVPTNELEVFVTPGSTQPPGEPAPKVEPVPVPNQQTTSPAETVYSDPLNEVKSSIYNWMDTMATTADIKLVANYVKKLSLKPAVKKKSIKREKTTK